MPEESLAGFCLLSLPSPDIQPLSILIVKDKAHAETTNVTVKNLFTDNTQPLPRPGSDAPILKGASRSLVMELSVEGHVSLLQHLLSLVKLSVDFKLENKRSVLVRLEKAMKKSVNEFNLDAFINSSLASTKSASFLEMLQASQLFVVTDIIKCRKYSFEYSTNKVTDAKLKVETPLDGGGNAGVRAEKSTNEEMSYEGEGDEDITVAVKAYRILHSPDKKTGLDSYRIRKEEAFRTVKGVEDFGGEPLDIEVISSPK